MIAFAFCPVVFGVGGIVLGVFGMTMSEKKGLGISGICVSAVGTVVGFIIGVVVSLALQNAR